MMIFRIAAVIGLFIFSTLAYSAEEGADKMTEQVTGKKILVVYYSRTGNTEKAAEAVARGLNADLEKLADKKSRKGIGGFFGGGRDAMKEKLTELEPLVKDPGKYDLVIIGTPVWGAKMAPAVRTYITQNKASLKEAAFFTTSGGTKPDKIVADMEKISGLKAKASIGFFPADLKKSGAVKYEKKLGEFVGKLK